MKRKSAGSIKPLYIPNNLDADSILEKAFACKKVRADRVANLKNAMYFILDSILQQMETREGRDQLDEDGLIPLHSDILGEICGKRYLEALKIMEDAGVLYRSKSYSVGNYSKGVCLIGEYAVTEPVIVEASHGSIRDKIMKYVHVQEQRNAQELQKIPYIIKWFNADLTLDEPGLHSFVEFNKKRIEDLHNRSGGIIDDISNRTNQRYNFSLSSARRIVQGDFRLKRTGADNRLHSAVSSFKKELRAFLLYKGQPLVGVDVNPANHTC